MPFWTAVFHWSIWRTTSDHPWTWAGDVLVFFSSTPAARAALKRSLSVSIVVARPLRRYAALATEAASRPWSDSVPRSARFWSVWTEVVKSSREARRAKMANIAVASNSTSTTAYPAAIRRPMVMLRIPASLLSLVVDPQPRVRGQRFKVQHGHELGVEVLDALAGGLLHALGGDAERQAVDRHHDGLRQLGAGVAVRDELPAQVEDRQHAPAVVDDAQ